MLIRSISGLRGITDSNSGLTDDTIVAYASSFATLLGNDGTVALGYDGRLGGKRIYELVARTLTAGGCDVLALGMVPTPTVMFAVEKNADVRGGISVTASHNGQEWNGMKFIAQTGLFLDKAENESLWEIADSRSWKTNIANGSISDGASVTDEHINSVLAIPFLALDEIAKRKFRIVLDAVNASGSFIQQKLLARLGVAEVIGVATDGSGRFPHTPEPIPENLSSLCDAVRGHNADLGIAVDPDADRCVLITETGEPFIEENTIVLAVEEALKNSPRGQNIVVNLSTTRAVEDIAKQYGANVYRTPVGEINVAKKMREVGAIIGGEGSGGVIYPDVHTGRDSLVAVALALGNLARSGMTLSEKKKSLPQYEIVKAKITLTRLSDVAPVIAKIKSTLSPTATSINEEDGLRMEFGNSWLHVRASNTEPVMRIIAEAPTRSEAEALIAQATAA
ncbi:MAG TPA: phosphoglucosamine mutase [Candidatus Kapabacteria bacterium]|nr:phosphoglucosamine mutase [Candidatus Kapabacteria bacterium]